jgi:hypothetical protein
MSAGDDGPAPPPSPCRQAYAEQEVRVRRQQDREWYSGVRREMRQSGSRRAYEQWLDEH